MQPDTTTTSADREGTRFGRYLLIGFFTVAPLWITWVVLDFVFSLLASTGEPFLRAAALALRPAYPELAGALVNPAFQYVLAGLFAVVGLYVIGFTASRVLGRRLIAFFERQLARVPVVQVVYGATRRFLETVRQKPATGQRVVLIAFPSPEMKAVGFVTRVMTDPDTGQELAAVYVPTSPNPTSGYIEIVPLADTVPTDWTMEEAMAFVMTGGTNAPPHLRFNRSPEPQP